MYLINTLLEYIIKTIGYLIFFGFWLWIPMYLAWKVFLIIMDWILDLNRLEDTDASL